MLTKLFSNLVSITFRQYVVNGMISLKYKISCLLCDKVIPYLNLSSTGIGVDPFLRKINLFENLPFVYYLLFVVHIPVNDM